MGQSCTSYSALRPVNELTLQRFSVNGEIMNEIA